MRRRRIWVGAAALVLTIAASGAAMAAKDTAPLPLDALFGGSFELIDQTGQIRTDRDFRGRYMLIFFGYANCPSICPTNLQEMAAALDLLGAEAERVEPVFVSIDPARDTPDVLKSFLANFGPRFVGLTGTEDQISEIARAYRVRRHKVTSEVESEHDYLVDHASLTYLMGPDGRFRTLFPFFTQAKVMAARIRSYLE